jgi:ABC-2 type transport system ATP-binding protein
MDPVIDIRHLRKVYGDVVAVRDVSLRLDQGTVLGVLGPNGAGKTTTVECAAGIRRPDGGTVRVLGHDPLSNPQAVRRRVGIQLQSAVLPARMRVGEAMAVFAAGFGDDHEDVDALLDRMGLADKRRAAFATLSGGQRQRLFIALALLGRPAVVVLDELTTGLDPAGRRDAWQVVTDLRDSGVGVILVTHAMDEAERLCDRLVVIDDGLVVADGTPQAVRGEHPTLEDAYLQLVGRGVRVTA